MTPKSQPDLDNETTWSPAVGDRVVIHYPDAFTAGRPNTPDKRVGEVSHLHASGCFTMISQPQGHSIYVDPDNCRTYGVTFDRWKASDGWPFQRIYTKPKDKKKPRVR